MLASLWASTNAALDTLRQDVGEFIDVVQNDTAEYLSNAAGSPTDKAASESTPVKSAGSKSTHGQSSLYESGDGSKSFLVLQEFTGRLEKERREALCDPGTYCNEPDGPPDLFQEWQRSFDLNACCTEISQLMVKNADVRALHAKFVPKVITHQLFWQRYYYRIHQIQKKKEQRDKRMKQLERKTEHAKTAKEDEDWDGLWNEDDWQPMDTSTGPTVPQSMDTFTGPTVPQSMDTSTGPTVPQSMASPTSAESSTRNDNRVSSPAPASHLSETDSAPSARTPPASSRQQTERSKRKGRPSRETAAQGRARRQGQQAASEKVRHWQQPVGKDLPSASSSSSLGDWDLTEHGDTPVTHVESRSSPTSPSDPDSPGAETSSSDIIVLDSVDSMMSSDGSELPSRQSPPLLDVEETHSKGGEKLPTAVGEKPVPAQRLVQAPGSGADSDFELVSDRDVVESAVVCSKAKSLTSLSSGTTPLVTEEEDEWETWD